MVVKHKHIIIWLGFCLVFIFAIFLTALVIWRSTNRLVHLSDASKITTAITALNLLHQGRTNDAIRLLELDAAASVVILAERSRLACQNDRHEVQKALQFARTYFKNTPTNGSKAQIIEAARVILFQDNDK